jgi:hypothetical protein
MIKSSTDNQGAAETHLTRRLQNITSQAEGYRRSSENQKPAEAHLTTRRLQKPIASQKSTEAHLTTRRLRKLT